MSTTHRRTGRSSSDGKAHAPHTGQLVRVGRYTILAGGMQDLRWNVEQVSGVDLLVPLVEEFHPCGIDMLPCPMRDFGGVPEGWADSLQEVIRELEAGKKILAFCVGSHGRTGTLLASLIALLEPQSRTPDPIRAVRRRHCVRAVETFEQAKGIFSLRGEPVLSIYNGLMGGPRELDAFQQGEQR